MQESSNNQTFDLKNLKGNRLFSDAILNLPTFSRNYSPYNLEKHKCP